MTTSIKVVASVVIGFVLGFGAYAIYASGHSSGGGDGEVSLGSVVNPNPQWFSAGIKIGTDNNLRLTGTLTIPAGQNQVSVKNLTGQTIYVQQGNAVMAGTASSTFKLYVGTTSAATVANVFSLSTAPMWSQFIDGVQVATSGSAALIADNITNHKTSYPGTLAVANGQYLTAVVSTFCVTRGACETATSSARGWTTITIPYVYYYSSPN